MSESDPKASLRRQVQDFYETHATLPAPEKLEAILHKYEKEDDLFAALCQKYKVDVAAATERRRKIQRIEQFYQQYAPSKISGIATALKRLDKFPELMDALRKKYTVTEEEFPNELAPQRAPRRKSAAAAPEPAPSQEPATALTPASQPTVTQPAVAPRPPATAPAPVPTPAAIEPAPVAETLAPAKMVPAHAPSPPIVQLESQATESANAALLFKIRSQNGAMMDAVQRGLRLAIDARLDALAMLPPAKAADASLVPGDVSLESNNRFLSHLADVEQRLLQRACEIQAFESSLAVRSAQLSKAEGSLTEKQRLLVAEFESFVATRSEDERSRVVLRAALDERRKSIDEQQAAHQARATDLQQRERDLEARQLAVAAREGELAAREGSLRVQQKALAEERALVKQLSEEVLRREATVRAVEKGLNQARAELTSLEGEVSARTQRLVADEGATRRWAEELEARESNTSRILEQLRRKGISVTGV